MRANCIGSRCTPPGDRLVYYRSTTSGSMKFFFIYWLFVWIMKMVVYGVIANRCWRHIRPRPTHIGLALRYYTSSFCIVRPHAYTSKSVWHRCHVKFRLKTGTEPWWSQMEASSQQKKTLILNDRLLEEWMFRTWRGRMKKKGGFRWRHCMIACLHQRDNC